MQVYEIPFYRFTYPLVSVFLCLNLFLWSCFDSVNSFRKEKILGRFKGDFALLPSNKIPKQKGRL